MEQIFLALLVLSDGGGGDDGGDIPTPFEDWSRVLTTSKGHVTTAPAVPATLKRRFLCLKYQLLGLKYFLIFRPKCL